MPRLLNDKLSFWTLRSVGRSAVRKNGGTLMLDPAAQGLAGLQVA